MSRYNASNPIHKNFPGSDYQVSTGSTQKRPSAIIIRSLSELLKKQY